MIQTKVLSTSVLVSSLVVFNACSMLGFRDGPPRHPRGFDIANIENAQPRPEPLSKYGNPDSYTVNGVRYEVLESAADYRATGKASWYGSKFHGKRTSSGEPYDAFAMTAAHKTLPIPSYVRVRNLENDKEIVVKVNDRGPFHPERVIDLSYAAAMKLGVYAKGTAEVEVLAIDPTGSGVWPSRSASREDFIKPLFVQIGAYSAQENAERVQYELKKSDIQSGIYVASSLNGHGKVFRVRVGPFTDRQDADRVARDLLTMGIPEAKIVSD